MTDAGLAHMGGCVGRQMVVLRSQADPLVWLKTKTAPAVESAKKQLESAAISGKKMLISAQVQDTHSKLR